MFRCQESSRKHFSPLWRSSEADAGLFLSDRKDLQSCSLHCGGTLKLVQACFSVGKIAQSSFLLCGGPVKLMQVFLCARNDQKSRFHHCGGLEKLV